MRALGEREFVGTESRLNTIFELLRQIVFGTEADPRARIEELTPAQAAAGRRDRAHRGGRPAACSTRAGCATATSSSSATARELLADFREVEENFRKLDRQLREKIAGWHGGKGELLDDVLGSRESIAGSDQGKSFQAFYDFLLSQARQEELSDLLDSVHELTEIAESDPRLRHIHYDWLDAAERTQTTVRQLSEQLRRFLDDQVWFENRRVIDILRGIESRALELRESGNIPANDGNRRRRARHQAADGTPAIYPGPQAPHRQHRGNARRRGRRDRPGEAVRAGLRGSRRRCAAASARRCDAPRRSGSSSSSRAHPLTQGLAELVTYLSLEGRGVRDRLRRPAHRAGQLDGAGRPGQDRHAAEGHVHQDSAARRDDRQAPSLDLSQAVTQLMKGVVYRDTHEKAWRHLLPSSRRYATTSPCWPACRRRRGRGLCVPPPAARRGPGRGDPLPRLIPRRSLSFHVSLLLALLRKKLAEFDAHGGDTRLMLSRSRSSKWSGYSCRRRATRRG